MKWIHELLVNINNDINTSEIKKNLSRYFLNNYFNNYWPSLGETAKVCFVSDSVVTNFAKNLGFSGYREFIFKAKEEFKNYNKSNIVSDLKNDNQMFENICNYFINIDNKINALVDILKNRKNIYLICSPILKNSVIDFYNLLINNNINCILLMNDRGLIARKDKIINGNDVILYFVSSFESFGIIEQYKYFKEKIIDNIIICDESKCDNFDTYKLMITLYNSNHSNIYEKISNLYMLFNIIDLKLKSSF